MIQIGNQVFGVFNAHRVKFVGSTTADLMTLCIQALSKVPVRRISGSIDWSPRDSNILFGSSVSKSPLSSVSGLPVIPEQSEEWLAIGREGRYFNRRFSDRVCFICVFSVAA